MHMQQDNSAPRRLLTVRAFSRETGFSTRMVKKAIELGEIRVVTFAGREMIPTSEADRVKELVT